LVGILTWGHSRTNDALIVFERRKKDAWSNPVNSQDLPAPVVDLEEKANRLTGEAMLCPQKVQRVTQAVHAREQVEDEKLGSSAFFRNWEDVGL
jgi:hypothetical protein